MQGIFVLTTMQHRNHHCGFMQEQHCTDVRRWDQLAIFFSSAGWANSITVKTVWVCLCVNQGGINHNRYTIEGICKITSKLLFIYLFRGPASLKSVYVISTLTTTDALTTQSCRYLDTM